jgi:hypothetical protein
MEDAVGGVKGGARRIEGELVEEVWRAARRSRRDSTTVQPSADTGSLEPPAAGESGERRWDAA